MLHKRDDTNHNLNRDDLNIKTQFKLKELLQKKGLEPAIFDNKIEFDAPIEEHAAWAFRNIYSTPYQELNKEKSTIARIHRGMSHICRAAIYAPVLINLYRMHGYEDARQLNDRDLKLIQIALLFHDAAREDDGEDKWDLESAGLLYFYLRMLGIEDEVAIKFAEYIGNKDSDKNLYDFKLHVTESELIWEQTEKKNITISQMIIHDADCLDIIRARDCFDASYLFFYRFIYRSSKFGSKFPKSMFDNEEVSLDHLAQLITEARSIIRKHGDTRCALKIEVKKRFEHENGYTESLKTIQDTNYHIFLLKDGNILSHLAREAICVQPQYMTLQTHCGT